jgi:hypothetical protein
MNLILKILANLLRCREVCITLSLKTTQHKQAALSTIQSLLSCSLHFSSAIFVSLYTAYGPVKAGYVNVKCPDNAFDTAIGCQPND